MDGLVCVVKRFFKEFARCVESPIALQICPGGWVKVCRGLARVSDGLVPVDVEIRFLGESFGVWVRPNVTRIGWCFGASFLDYAFFGGNSTQLGCA